MSKQPVNLPDPPEPPPEGGDKLAEQEAGALANNELEQEALAAEHGRSEWIKNHVAKAAIFLFWLIVVLFVVALLIVAWHIFLPERYGWLQPDAIGELKALITGVALSGGVQSYAKKHLK